MAAAVIDLEFDPFLRIGGLAVRWETVALVAILLGCVALAAILAGRETGRGAGGEAGEDEGRGSRLRRDDLLFMLVGAVPGALVGGRVGYVLTHLDFYGQHPGAWLDSGQGSLELSVGLLGGVASGVAVGVVLASPIGRWLRVATIPVLLAMGLGKLAMALDGSGQGLRSNLPWATAYFGPGPWASLDVSTPAHPAQVYEGLLTLIVAALLGGLLFAGRFPRRDGTVFLAGITLWALARVEAGFLWQDQVVIGPFRAAQILGLAIAAASLGLFVWRSMALRTATSAATSPATAGPIAATMHSLMSISPIEAEGVPERPVPAGGTAPGRGGPLADVGALLAAHDLLRGREAAGIALETGTVLTMTAALRSSQSARTVLQRYRAVRPWFDEAPPARSGWLTQVRLAGEPPDVDVAAPESGVLTRRRRAWPTVSDERPSWVAAEAKARQRTTVRVEPEPPD